MPINDVGFLPSQRPVLATRLRGSCRYTGLVPATVDFDEGYAREQVACGNTRQVLLLRALVVTRVKEHSRKRDGGKVRTTIESAAHLFKNYEQLNKSEP